MRPTPTIARCTSLHASFCLRQTHTPATRCAVLSHAALPSAAQSARYLVDALDVWESFAGQPGIKAPRLIKPPLALQVRVLA